MIDQQIRAALEAELKEISERYNLHSLNVCWSTVAGSENDHHSNMQHEKPCQLTPI